MAVLAVCVNLLVIKTCDTPAAAPCKTHQPHGRANSRNVEKSACKITFFQSSECSARRKREVPSGSKPRRFIAYSGEVVKQVPN